MTGWDLEALAAGLRWDGGDLSLEVGDAAADRTVGMSLGAPLRR